MASYSPNEMMTVAAARALKSSDVCFVGIGQPSAACNLARLTHAPHITLIYESGTIATKPSILPLSIGDGELCVTALTTVSVPEMFRYWLQGGRITIGFLGAAQLDRFANINTTVIVMPQGKRSFVERIDFRTSLGHGTGQGDRARHGVTTKGPSRVFTDLCIMQPDPVTKELTVTSIHPGVTREKIAENTGWAVKFADRIEETP